jgi:hypothetical protein
MSARCQQHKEYAMLVSLKERNIPLFPPLLPIPPLPRPPPFPSSWPRPMPLPPGLVPISPLPLPRPTPGGFRSAVTITLIIQNSTEPINISEKLVNLYRYSIISKLVYVCPGISPAHNLSVLSVYQKKVDAGSS